MCLTDRTAWLVICRLWAACTPLVHQRPHAAAFHLVRGSHKQDSEGAASSLDSFLCPGLSPKLSPAARTVHLATPSHAPAGAPAALRIPALGADHAPSIRTARRAPPEHRDLLSKGLHPVDQAVPRQLRLLHLCPAPHARQARLHDHRGGAGGGQAGPAAGLHGSALHTRQARATVLCKLCYIASLAAQPAPCSTLAAVTSWL